MANIISIFSSITTILFSISQGDIVYIAENKKTNGIKITSSFSITCCIIYELILFFYYYFNEDKEESKILTWSLFTGVIISFAWIGIYLYYYYKDNKKINFYHYLLYLLTIVDILFEIWLIEKDILSDEKIENNKLYIQIFIITFNVLMYINPGLNIFKLFSEKNYSYISLPILSIGLINSIVWLLLGIMSDNTSWFYIWGNIIGILIGLIQLFLFLYFKYNKNIIRNESLLDNKSEKSKKKRKIKKKIRKLSKEEIRKEIKDDDLNFV
jgi:hypothetical protein